MYRPHYASSRTTSRIAPHFAYVPHNATCHVLYATFQITPYSIGHTMHRTAFRITFYTTLHCIPPQLTVIIPNSKSHYHVSQHSTSHISADRPILHPTTYRAVSQPTLCLIPHRTTFHIPCHSTHTNPYYTTAFHNPIPVWETRTV